MRGAARSTVRHRVWLTARCLTTVPMARAQALGEDIDEADAAVAEGSRGPARRPSAKGVAVTAVEIA